MIETEGWDRVDGISVVIPAYRTPGTLLQICEELERHVRPLTLDMELIVVDDGSPDATWQQVQSAAEQHDWVRGVRLSRNYGQHNALLAGLREARLPLILTIDDDLQNPPSQVPLLFAALRDDVDLVYGSPADETQSALRNAASVVVKRCMSKLLGPEVNARMSSMRLFRQHLLSASEAADDPYVSIDVLLTWATTKVEAVEVAFAPRSGGQSGYSIGKLVRHALNMITGYSTRPLRWVSLLGLVIAMVGFALLAFVLVQFVVEPADVEGFAFLASAISLFSGVQLLSLGIVGEYLARMHFRTMGRPAYTIRERA